MYGLTPRAAHLTVLACVLGYFKDEENHTMAMYDHPPSSPAVSKDAYRGQSGVLQQRSAVLVSIRVLVLQRHWHNTTRHDGWESRNLNDSIRGRNVLGDGRRGWGLVVLLVGAVDSTAFALTRWTVIDGAGQA